MIYERDGVTNHLQGVQMYQRQLIWLRSACMRRVGCSRYGDVLP